MACNTSGPRPLGRKSTILNSSHRKPRGEAASVPTAVARSAGTPEESGTVPDMCSKAQYELEAPLVSIVIPCYNQAHFLGEAIESVLKQTYKHFEIVVVDDGSTDNTSEVARGYSGIRCIEQVNQGLSAARNTGIRESKGEYLVFLDADDRLYPIALEAGLRCFRAFPQCGFVYGAYRFINSKGSPLWSPILNRVDKEHYLALLRENYIGMNGTVMFRRDVLEVFGGFDTSLAACEDYDLYLRVARTFSIRHHDNVVAEYRKHVGNMSCDAELMLRTILFVLGSQWKYAKQDKRYRKAYNAGFRHAKGFYGIKLLKQVYRRIRVRLESKQAVREVRLLLGYVGVPTFLLYAPLWFGKLTAWKVKDVILWACGRGVEEY